MARLASYSQFSIEARRPITVPDAPRLLSRRQIGADRSRSLRAESDRHIVEKVIDGHGKHQAEFAKLGRADAIDATLVFLHLLEHEPDRGAELLLAHAQVHPAQSDARADVRIDR